MSVSRRLWAYIVAVAPRQNENAADAPKAVRLAVKVVPGARRDEIAGRLGDRLKVRVSAPPEGGRANAAVCRVIAASLGVKPGAVAIVAGHSSPEKLVEITGVEPGRVAALLG